mmetsp:Transcript_7917/g.19650  ORF Transcript_7917/g.19650 Transcript_7917/m.19650 type:complete len:267 (-) Transcript_7917:2067-2867(-)
MGGGASRLEGAGAAVVGAVVAAGDSDGVGSMLSPCLAPMDAAAVLRASCCSRRATACGSAFRSSGASLSTTAPPPGIDPGPPLLSAARTVNAWRPGPAPPPSSCGKTWGTRHSSPKMAGATSLPKGTSRASSRWAAALLGRTPPPPSPVCFLRGDRGGVLALESTPAPFPSAPSQPPASSPSTVDTRTWVRADTVACPWRMKNTPLPNSFAPTIWSPGAAATALSFSASTRRSASDTLLAGNSSVERKKAPTSSASAFSTERRTAS